MPKATDILRRRQLRQLQAQRGIQYFLRGCASLVASALAGLILLSIGAAAALGAAYDYFTRDLPSAEALQVALSPENAEFFQTTRIYDRSGQNVIYEVIDPRGGDRQYIFYNAIPPEVISATVALEDKTFFTNPGYDLLGIARALVSNLRGEPIQGGSSITQQLVKNTLIPLEKRAERSYERKIRETLLAAEITRRYSKEQLLEWYLNTNFYGNLAYGIDAAALVYFGKHAPQLTLAEAAMLAAIPQSPGLNPVDDFDEAKKRQELVLDVMAREGFVSPEAAGTAKALPITIQPPVKRFDIQAPHFSVYVRQQVVAILNRLGLDGEDTVNRGGLRVTTTLDLDLQHQAECVARTQIARLAGAASDAIVPAEGASDCAAAQFIPQIAKEEVGQDHNATNASVVVLDPRMGEILALVGSADYWNPAIAGNFNVAVDGQRQPGSSFKPFTYIEAFRVGYAPASMLLDVRTLFPTASGEAYVPENYDRKFHGPVSMRQALARSYNIPAVQTIHQVGVDNVIRLAHRLGLNTLETGNYGLALTLGGGEVTLLDMTYAYGVLANMGVMAGQPVPDEAQRPGFRQLDPVSVLRIEDDSGQVIYEHSAPDTQPILSPPLAYLVNDVLSDSESRVPAFGRGNPLELPDRPAAAKTGTTNDFRDNWTLGYVPQLAVGVWVGNSDSSPMKGVTGLSGAAPIWQALMQYATQTRNLSPQGWEAPAGIVRVRVCEPSGLLPTRYCQRIREEVFLSGNEPVTADAMWQPVIVNRETNKRATACTPPELVETRIYQILPPEAADWAQAVNLPQPPSEYDPIGAQCLPVGNVAVLTPKPFAYLRGVVEITGTAKADNFAFFRVQYGRGLYPTEYTQIGGDRPEQIEPPGAVLQLWDTAGLDGLYLLQLVVVKNDPNGGPFQFETSAVPVTIDNQPPTVQVLTPAPGAEFNLSDESVVIQPQVQDNLSLARVEIYVDNALIETATVAPYSTRWKMRGAGQHVLFVRAFDAAGNFAESERVTIAVR